MRPSALVLAFVLPSCGGAPATSPGADGGSFEGDLAAPGDLALARLDPIQLAGAVKQDELAKTIVALEGFGSRHTVAAGNAAARDYLKARLEALGLPVEVDPFMVKGTAAYNLIARKAGAVASGPVYLFSAHYDSISPEPMSRAPGADDNASGVAAVIEAARILAPMPTRHAVWFVLTGAEEQGSRGSAHLVGWLKSRAVDVRGVIAPDMIGYWPKRDADAFDILGDDGSKALVDRMASVADQLGVPHKKWIRHDYCYGDDHSNFQEAGFPAISPMDCVEAHNLPASGEKTPHYHQTTDRSDTLYLPFTARVVGVIVATLGGLAAP